jgi:hypothetical protein
MSLIEHAERELANLRGDEPDEMQDLIEQNVLECVAAFAGAGHSGSSAAYTINILERVLRYEPIVPLTGVEDEWEEIGEDHYQNLRCPHVFREHGQAYDTQAIIFRDPDGYTYTNRDSHRKIKFPYTPTTSIIDQRR